MQLQGREQEAWKAGGHPGPAAGAAKDRDPGGYKFKKEIGS